MAVERVAGFVEGDVLGQQHRQIFLGHRNDAAGLAVDHRNRAAPVALARNAPIAQAIVDLALADRPVAAGFALKTPRHFRAGFGRSQAVEEPRIDQGSVTVVGGIGDTEGFGVLAGRANDRRVAEAVFVDEIEVALVVRRAAENRAGAVVHEDEVGHIDRQLPVRIERVDGLDPGVEAELFRLVDQFLRGAGALALGDEVLERRIFRRGGLRQRMIGRDRHEAGAEQGVVAGGEHFQFGFAGGRGRGIERKADQQTFGAADPVLLHDAHFFRPAVELIQRGQEVVGKGGDLEEPLGQLALLDRRTASPAAAVDHLLVGEHGLVHRVPVHLGFFALDEAGAHEIQKHFLLVLVVGGIAGGDFARPVERQSHGLELLFHGGDVVVGPCLGVNFALDGGVLRRHAEGVPAHGMEHLEALGALVAGHHVAHGVIAHMPHVDAAGGVGEHLQHVVFGAGGVVLGGENAALGPDLLPARLGFAGVVAVGRHRGHGRHF